MIRTAATRRATLAPAVSFHVDPDAERGDVVPALAALLISQSRARREREAGEPQPDQDGEEQP